MSSIAAWIVILAGMLLLAFWIVLLSEMDRARAHYIANAERNTASLSLALAERTGRTLHSAEGLLKRIQRDLTLGHDPSLTTAIERNPNLSGAVGYIAVFDAAGNILMNSGGLLPGTSAAGSEWLERIKAADPGTIILGKPTIDRAIRSSTIPIAMRLENADGSFDGALQIAILVDYLDSFYPWDDIGQHGATAIYGLDGTVYARRSIGGTDAGKPYANFDLIARAKERPNGVFHLDADFDGVPRITGYRLVGEYPWIVSVGFADEDVLAPYQMRRRLMIAQGVALTLIVMLLAGVVTSMLSRERAARAAAASSERRLRDAIESMDASFVLFDADDRLVMRTAKFLDQTPFPQDGADIVGMRFEELVRAATAAGWFKSTLAERNPEAWVVQCVSRHRNPPSEPFEVQLVDGRWLNISERRTADGFTVGVYSDTTRRKQQEAALRNNEEHLQRLVTELELSRQQLENQAADLARLAEETDGAKRRAEAANVSKSLFLANMSHELRTPLNAIIGFSDLMKGQLLGPIGSPRYLEYAKDIHSSGMHLLSLINDVLDMSKIEAGRYEIHPEPVDGAEMLRSCIRLVRVRASEAGVSLGIGVAQELSLQADARALKQVVLNLLTNAIKFTPAGGSVNLSAGYEEDGVVFRVADTGVGIPEEDLPRIGRRFEQVDNALTRKGEGTGLGLALSRSLVELHGGTLTIESAVGTGTTVTVWLPATVKSERAA